ncbi:MAG: LLM class flavin-dependent oxidoreductase, partial [Actinomycetota bacterium]|nr:LLM class flavin-dependent oxidoreductase [Actinomycetota bacterium]
MTPEFWSTARGVEATPAERARRLEADGWFGLGHVDSECLAQDPYVALTTAALATSRLRLATSVTNSATRHPAVAAACAASVQMHSGGRFVLGIGRGDSALAHLGLAPAPVKQFDHYLERLQGFLDGAEVPFDLDSDAVSGLRSSSTLGMAGGPTGARLKWIQGPKVPVDVAASGPKVITVAAHRADAVTFALGIDRDRLKWAVALARSERTVSPRAAQDLQMGTYVPMYVDNDRSVARQMISGAVGSYARFSVMHGSVAAPIEEGKRRALEKVHSAYDMNAHFTQGSPQAQELTDDLID